MKIRIPRSSNPLTRLTITTPLGVSRTTFDDSHHWFDYQPPLGVTEAQVTIIAEFMNECHAVDSRMKPVMVCEARPEPLAIDMTTVNRSLADIEAGRVRPIEDVIDDFRSEPVTGRFVIEHSRDGEVIEKIECLNAITSEGTDILLDVPVSVKEMHTEPLVGEVVLEPKYPRRRKTT